VTLAAPSGHAEIEKGHPSAVDGCCSISGTI